jgi:hypothetical protein
LEEIEYLEMMHCAGVLGTCVMIDGILNGPTDDLPDDAIDWLSSNKKLAIKRLLPQAVEGLDAILGEESEMNDL